MGAAPLKYEPCICAFILWTFLDRFVLDILCVMLPISKRAQKPVFGRAVSLGISIFFGNYFSKIFDVKKFRLVTY